MKAYAHGGKHEGKYPVVVWSGVVAHPYSTKNTFDGLNKMNKPPHFVWNTFTGEILEGVSLDKAAKGFSKEINRGGAPCIQIAVCQVSSYPFTSSNMENKEEILAILREHGIPDEFPLGPPNAYNMRHDLLQSFPAAGHYASNQIDPTAYGIGSIDSRRLFSE